MLQNMMKTYFAVLAGVSGTLALIILRKVLVTLDLLDTELVENFSATFQTERKIAIYLIAILFGASTIYTLQVGALSELKVSNIFVVFLLCLAAIEDVYFSFVNVWFIHIAITLGIFATIINKASKYAIVVAIIASICLVAECMVPQDSLENVNKAVSKRLFKTEVGAFSYVDAGALFAIMLTQRDLISGMCVVLTICYLSLMAITISRIRHHQSICETNGIRFLYPVAFVGCILPFMEPIILRFINF